MFRQHLAAPYVRRPWQNANTAIQISVPFDYLASAAIRDPDDVIYLIVADVGGADLIITGNGRDFVETTYGPARVITARAFLEEFG
ncbi:hypothetical protein [Niveispirillum sp.]|uniref:hypothetical protein n=1 Tax=Niveispirillum sp. TaxID=1917217 RepID=UPI003BA8B4B6